MAKEVKGLITEELRRRLDGVDGLVMVDTTGFDAHQAEEFRRELREANLQMMVVKNSLARRALEDVGLGGAGECIQGPTALLFGEDGPVRVTIQVVDLLQQFVATPITLGQPLGEGIPVEDLEYGEPGRYEVVWDGKNLKGARVASGTYFVRLRVGDLTRVMKVILPK